MKIKAFRLRSLLLGTSLLIVIACTDHGHGQDKAAANKNKAATTQHKETAAQAAAATDQDKGAAHFEAGLTAVDAKDMPLAFKEFLAAAKAGHPDAQFNVALMYEQGMGVSKNEKEAFSWYEKAALQGNSAAQFNLGVLYENGRGTAVDFAKANAWYRKASVQGDGLAVGNLGMLYIRGQGVPENQVAGMALLLLSAAMDTSPENHARNNISKTRGLTTAMVTEAQTLSAEMGKAENLLEPLDAYLNQ